MLPRLCLVLVSIQRSVDGVDDIVWLRKSSSLEVLCIRHRNIDASDTLHGSIKVVESLSYRWKQSQRTYSP